MTHVLPTEPKLISFLEALPRADAGELCSPPGLGGLWRVRHVRNGLERGVLVVHHSGKGLAYAAYPSAHGACKECSGKRSICDHCNCTHCAFDRLTQERHGPHVSRETVERLRAQVSAFRVGAVQPVASLLDADI